MNNRFNPFASLTGKSGTGYNQNNPAVANAQQYYQIKPGDTYDDIAKQYNIPTQDLQNINKSLVVPPKGSYISLNNPSFRAAKPGAMQPTPYTNPAYQGANSFVGPTGGINFETRETVANVEAQLKNGIVPPAIPFSVSKKMINPATGQPFTDQEFIATGYTYDNQRQTWVQGNTVPTETANAQPTVPSTPAEIRAYNTSQGLMWDKNLAAWIPRAAWIAKRKAGWQRRHAAPVGEATNTGAAPVTSLDVRLGSG